MVAARVFCRGEIVRDLGSEWSLDMTKSARVALSVVAVAICVLVIYVRPLASAALVIGGFDVSRAGGFSARDGDRWPGLRTAIAFAFPGGTITAASSGAPHPAVATASAMSTIRWATEISCTVCSLALV